MGWKYDWAVTVADPKTSSAAGKRVSQPSCACRPESCHFAKLAVLY